MRRLRLTELMALAWVIWFCVAMYMSYTRQLPDTTEIVPVAAPIACMRLGPEREVWQRPDGYTAQPYGRKPDQA